MYHCVGISSRFQQYATRPESCCHSGVMRLARSAQVTWFDLLGLSSQVTWFDLLGLSPQGRPAWFDPSGKPSGMSSGRLSGIYDDYLELELREAITFDSELRLECS